MNLTFPVLYTCIQCLEFDFLVQLLDIKPKLYFCCMGCPQYLPMWQGFWAIIKLKQALQGLKHEGNIYARLRIERGAGIYYA